MKRFLLVVVAALLGYSTQAQDWKPTCHSFNKEYTSVNAYTLSDTTWIHQGSTNFEWLFLYNVELLTSPKTNGPALGVMMNCEEKGDYFFFSFVEFIENDSTSQECLVDVFRKDRERGWEFVSAGEIMFRGREAQVMFGDYKLNYTQ